MYYWLKCRHDFYRRPIWMLSPASIVITMWPMLYPSLSIKPYKYFGEQHHSWSTRTQPELPIRIYWLHNSKPFSGWSNLYWICMLRSFITASSSRHCSRMIRAQVELSRNRQQCCRTSDAFTDFIDRFQLKVINSYLYGVISSVWGMFANENIWC